MAEKKASSGKTAKVEPKKNEATKKIKDNKKGEKSKSQKKKIAFYSVIGGIAIIVVVVFFLVLTFGSQSEITAAKLINSYAKDADYIKDVIETYDPDGLMGTENEYISKSSWEDSRINNKVEDHAGTIEIFKNSKDAEVREWYLDKVSETCSKYITVKKYGKDYYEQICDGLGYGTTYRNQMVVIRLSMAFTNEQVSEYKSKFNDLIKKYKITETDVPSDDRVAELKKEGEEKLERVFSKQEEDFKNRLDGLAGDMDDSINKALSSLSEADLSSLKEDLTYLKTIPYFSEKITGWEKQINEISDKIAQNKAEAARKAEEEEKARKAAKTRTFSAGKYMVGRDIDSGTYNVTAISGSGNFFVDNASGRSTINEVMSPSGGSFYLTNYKNAYLGSGYEIEIKGNLILKFEIVE